MRRVILLRVAAFVPTLFLSTVLVFALQTLIPGGPADALAGSNADGQAIAAINKRLGLDHPLVVQYVHWIGGIFSGHLGDSYINGVSVSTIIKQRLPPSLELVIGAIVLAVVVGGGAGLLAAIRRDRFSGKAILSASAIGLSIPDFWAATILAGVFGISLGVVPAAGYTPISQNLGKNIHSVILPIIILAVPSGALIARHVQSATAAALQSPYIRTAWAMGLPPRQVYFKCALRNALGPVITFLPLVLAGLVGAAVIVEDIFDIPGLGSEIVNAVNSRDYSVLQAIVLILAVLVLVLNLAADLLMAVIDPRVNRS